MQTYTEKTTPRRGLKASVQNVGDAYILDTASRAGVLVVPAAAGHCDLPSSAADVAKALGVIAYDCVQDPATTSTNDFDADEAVEVVDSGQIWMVAEAGLAVGDQPYARHTSGAGGTVLGAVRADADTATAALLPNSRVIAVTTGLAKVKVNLPHGAAS